VIKQTPATLAASEPYHSVVIQLCRFHHQTCVVNSSSELVQV